MWIMSTVWRSSRSHSIRVPSTGNRTVHKETWQSVCARKWGKKTSEQWCDHVPKSTETSPGGKVRTLWTRQVQTGRTIPNNKRGNILEIRDNDNGKCLVTDCCNFRRRQKCDQERSRGNSTICRPYNVNIGHVDCENKSDTSDDRGNWNFVSNVTCCIH